MSPSIGVFDILESLQITFTPKSIHYQIKKMSYTLFFVRPDKFLKIFDCKRLKLIKQ